ncbi:hypothetical protein F2P44_28660 [Massilia sp. CCM 8695]|uniref:Uncharacterized protein n=1 Tax=Massilia frigida TaxID=2609281 RepID=A0ABX0NK28_9BURK|nr:hypothetical protein [Massilia frigida]
MRAENFTFIKSLTFVAHVEVIDAPEASGYGLMRAVKEEGEYPVSRKCVFADEKKPRFALSAILSALRLTGVFLL